MVNKFNLVILVVSGVSNSLALRKFNYFQMTLMLWFLGNRLCDKVLQQKAVQDIIHSKDQHFDLIITEAFNSDCFLGFVHKFKTPLIQVVTFGGTPWIGDWVGNPSPYSYVPDPFQNFGDRMDFCERVLNTLGITFQKMSRFFYFLPQQQAIMEKYFREFAPLPSISELQSSTSLLLLNHHFSISYPRPLMPNVVQVGGMHVKPAKKLPEVSTCLHYIISSGSAAQRGLWPLCPRGFLITHNDAPQSVGLHWTSDQPVAETST
jgi:glucuronosyltransferase